MSAPDATTTATPVNKALRPLPGSPRDYQFPRFERRTLSNGIKLVVAPATKLPLATVLVLFDAGAVADPDGREGTAQLVAKLLIEGTQEFDGAELTEQFERLGASIDASAGWDASEVVMTSLSEHLPDAFKLLGQVITSPAFRPREIQRLKAERLAELLQLRAEPRGLADEFFSRFVYTPASRYARPEGGDEKSVDEIERENILAFYESRYAPGGTTLIIVGDVSVDVAETMAREALGEWKGATPERVVANDTPARFERAVHLIAKSDAPQSELRIGHVGIPRNHPDFFPVNVMNAVLGGLFNSRINLNLREAHGYTYGAFSGFDWRRQAGPFAVHTAVKSDVTEAAAREILLEIDRIQAQPIAPDELSLATSYLDGVFPIRFESTSSIAAALATLVIHGLPEDYYDRYREHVRSMTVEQIHEAAQHYLKSEALQMVVVGDPTAVSASLEAMQFGPLSVYDTQGNRLS
ncbi:MAG TPA: pitrilysin family protein [Gemmatimonadaceae bacterium]|jgi:zinc protease